MEKSKLALAIDSLIETVEMESEAVQRSGTKWVTLRNISGISSRDGLEIIRTSEPNEYAHVGTLTTIRSGKLTARAEVLSSEPGQLTLAVLDPFKDPCGELEIQLPQPDYLNSLIESLQHYREELQSPSSVSLAQVLLGPRYLSANEGSAVEYVIGPPGSGKTHKLVDYAVSRANCQARILIVTYTNAAADLIFQRLAQHPGVSQHAEIVRFGLTEAALKVQDAGGKSGVKASRSINELERASMVITTSHRVAWLRGLGLPQWDEVIIDEGSSMPLPFAVISATLGQRHIKVFGDPFQLGPISRLGWNEQDALEFPFRMSVFEAPGMPQMLDGGHVGTVLKAQYRLPARIQRVALPPLYLSNNTSPSTAGDSTETPWGIGSLVYFDSSRLEPVCQRTADHSRINRKHVDVVLEAVRMLLEQELINPDEPTAALNIITPYRAQRTAIRDALESREWLKPDAAASVVTTIHQSQGRESEFVIIDTVDAASLDNPNHTTGRVWEGVGWKTPGSRLLTVALTRTRRQCLIVLHRNSFGQRLDEEGYSTLALARINGLLNSYGNPASIVF